MFTLLELLSGHVLRDHIRPLKERKKRPKRVVVWGPQNHQTSSLKRSETEGVKLESVKPHLDK